MANKKIQLTTNVDNQIVDVYPVTKSEFVEFSDGKTLDEKINTASTEHKHDLATPAKDGFMSKEDKAKLDGVTNYTHPNTHAATMITEDNDHRFVTDAEKNKWNNKADTSLATNASNGLMSASDKQKINELNNQFKNRDDKINKNKEDIKFWNNEMVDKRYQYLNEENNIIDDSIISKTSDMIIQGKTLQNLCIGVKNKASYFIVEDSIVKTNGIPAVGNILFEVLLKASTTYTIIINVIENTLTNQSICYDLFPDNFEEFTRTSPGDKGYKVIKFTTPSNISDLQGFRIYFNDADSGNVKLNKPLILEGDWSNKDFPEYFEGIKSFGEEENKIDILSHGRNLVDYSMFKASSDTKVTINSDNIILEGNRAYANMWIDLNKLNLIEGKTYYASANIQSIIGNNSAYFEIWINDKKTGQTSFTYKRTNNITLYIFANNNKFPSKNIVTNIMLLDKPNENYEKYRGNKKNISLDKHNLNSGLKGLTTTIYDEINSVNNTIVERIGKIVVDGNLDNDNRYRYDSVSKKFILNIKNLSIDKKNRMVLCNKIPYNEEAYMEDNKYGISGWIDETAAFVGRWDFGNSVVNDETFANYLKNNNLIIYYVLEDPIEREFKEDINLKTFSKKTHIFSNNNIKGKLSFTVPVNTAANLENNSNRLNTVEDYIDNNKNNKEKINKLEEGAVTSSLNIIDLQKEINNDNNYTNHKGVNIVVNDLLNNNRTSNIVIKGNTFQNLAFEQTYIINPNGSQQYYAFGQNQHFFVPGEYTLKNTTGIALIWDIYQTSTGNWIRSIKSNKSIVVTLEADQAITNMQALTVNGWTLDANTRNILRENLIILKGNKLDIIDELSYFDSIKSIGEDEENYIKLLSTNKNLCDIKKTYTDYKGFSFSTDNDKIVMSGNVENAWAYVGIPVSLKGNAYYTFSFKGKGNNSFLKANIVLQNNKSKSLTGDINANTDRIFWVENKCDIIIKLFFSGSTTGSFNVEYWDIQIEENNKQTSYENHKEHSKLVKLKEPLRSGDLLYNYNSKIQVKRCYHKLDLKNVTISEISIRNNARNTNWFQTTYIPSLSNAKKNTENINNKFTGVNAEISWKDENDYECLSIAVQDNGVRIQGRIKKNISKEELQNKLSNLIIYYESTNPTIEEIETSNIDLKIFKNKTHFKSLNKIKPYIDFYISNNLKTQNKEHTDNINTSFDLIDDINNKTSKLEAAQMTTALNVLELKKHTDMLNNEQPNDYIDHSGEYLECNNTLDSRTEEMIIRGKTLKNLIDYSAFGAEYSIKDCAIFCPNGDSRPWENVGSLTNMLKPNTEYTLFAKNIGEVKGRLQYKYKIDGGPSYYDLNPKEEKRITFTTNSQLYFAFKFYFIDAPAETRCQVVLLEGNVPTLNTYFKGIISTGETEYNYLNKNQISLGYIGTDDGTTYIIPPSDDGSRTAIIECEPNTIYTLVKEFATERFVIKTSSVKPVTNTKCKDVTRLSWTRDCYGKEYSIIITPPDAKYLLAYVTLDNKITSPGKINIKKGYSSFDLTLPNKHYINLLSVGDNLFNYKTDYTSWWVNIEGVLYKNEENTKYSIICPIYDLNTEYQLIAYGKDRCTVAYLDQYDNILSFYPLSDNSNPVTIPVPPCGAKKILCYLKAPGYDTSIDNGIMLSAKKINHKPYINSKMSIILDEPLYAGNYIFEKNNKINLYKRYDSYIFNGNEKWVLGTNDGGWSQYEDTLVFYISSSPKISVNSNFICDKYVFKNIISNNGEGIYNAVWGGAAHPAIRIKKSKLGGQSVEGFKKWLKENPVKIIYEISNPIEKNINCVDININTYKDTTTYITTNNAIKPSLEFKTQNNFGVIMKNISKCINKIFNSLNNILNIKGE